MTGWGLFDVSVEIGAIVALDRVSLEVRPGEIVAVIGGDGAGKSTVCRVLAGLVPTSKGQVRRPGGHRTGYLPPSSGTWPDLTVTENLAFVGAVYRLNKIEFQRRLQALLETTALTEAGDRLGGELSGGMRQKLGVAMALLPQPELLVLDEPTTGVDPVSRFELWRLMSHIAAEGTAVVMTTTYLDEAERASRVLALESGVVLAWGEQDDVKAALPGQIFTADYRIDHPYRWRRGKAWRFWSPDGIAPPGARSTDPDLSDLLTAAALAHELKVPA